MGFSSISGDPFGIVLHADNASYDGTQRGGVIGTNGQLWIGSSVSPRVKVGTITSPDSSIIIGYSSPNITIRNSLANGRFPITPYVVGPIGQAGYQTIQSAINAASLAGGGLVYVQYGTYTENLVFPAIGNIGLTGDSEQATIIVGVHTPPTSGFLNIDRMTLSSPTNIFLSAATGTTSIIIEDCTLIATSGYAFNLLNWSGSIGIFDVASIGANDGGINNTGGSPIFAFSVSMGSGGSNVMTLSGFLLITTSEFAAPITLATGTTGTFDYCSFANTVTCANNSTVTFSYSKFNTGTTPALTMSSSAAVNIFHATINTSNNPAISGAGAGTLTYTNIVFLNNAAFAGTLTLAKKSWQPYSIALAASDGTKVGTCNFNSTQFTVDANGFVSTTGIAANSITKVIVQTFIGNGTYTYTPTVGMKYVTLEVVGSGAGGGGAASTSAIQVAAAAGGGPGGYARKTVAAAVIGASQTVIVAAGGAGGSAGNNNGTNGNTSSIGAIVSASGGLAGGGSGAGNIAAVNPGASGIGSSGDINSVGAEGVPSYALYLAVFTSGILMGGGGGNSYFGGGARGGVAFSGSFNGINGFAYGGGGSGGFSGVSGAAASGGNGSDGVVICTEYVSA